MSMILLFFSLVVSSFSMPLFTGIPGGFESGKTVRLYALDCGEIDVSDMSVFADDGRLDGKKANLVVPCFLVRHPKGNLIWDTGYPESLAEIPEGVKFAKFFHKKMTTTLTNQLGQLELRPSDIDYLAISHFHDDHSGNSNLFRDSTFIANEAEHRHMFSAGARANEAFSVYSELEKTKTVFFKEKHDVFGDGSVVIKSMPGHTPGSSVLLLRLRNSGALLLTGDLYTHSKARELGTIPKFNFDKALTRQSRKRFEALAQKEKARVVIQHSRRDFEALPGFPKYLD